MRTYEELMQEILNNPELKKEFGEYVKAQKTQEFLRLHGVDDSLDNLKAYLETKRGELSDVELNMVSGGGCGDYPPVVVLLSVVTIAYWCLWEKEHRNS